MWETEGEGVSGLGNPAERDKAQKGKLLALVRGKEAGTYAELKDMFLTGIP